MEYEEHISLLISLHISLLIIPCIIYYVTNKETLNLEHLSCRPTRETRASCSHLPFHFLESV